MKMPVISTGGGPALLAAAADTSSRSYETHRTYPGRQVFGKRFFPAFPQLRAVSGSVKNVRKAEQMSPLSSAVMFPSPRATG